VSETRIVIRLAIGEDDNTWVTSIPVRLAYLNQPRSAAVASAATEALGHFLDNILREREMVTERMVRLEARCV
jgi:hypothetical protein